MDPSGTVVRCGDPGPSWSRAPRSSSPVFLLPFFGLGAGAAAVAGFAGAEFEIQLLVFVVASVAFFADPRALAKRLNRLSEPEGAGSESADEPGSRRHAMAQRRRAVRTTP